MNALAKFWSKASLNEPPYIHPDDTLDVRKIHDPMLSSFEDYEAAFRENKFKPTDYLTGLLPQPYMGNLEAADIFILMLNPGFHPIDLYAQEKHKRYREAILATVKQECASHMFLDPKWSWTAGFQWWEKKLRQTIKILADRHFNNNYALALESAAQKIASIELIAYPSQSFLGKTNLASCEKAREFVRNLPKNKTIIVSRRVKEWAIPKNNNIVHYQSAQSRNASLGPNSPGGKAILDYYQKCYRQK